MSVLHLLDPGAVGGGAMTVRFIADVLHARGGDDCIIVLGHREHARMAERCGLRVDAVVPAPRPTRLRPTRGMARVMQALWRTRGPFELVHAWSMRSEALAARLLPDKPCVVSTMVGPELERGVVGRACVQLAPAVLVRTAQLRFFVPHQGLQRELSAAGVFEDVVWTVEPGVDVRAIRHDARAALRAKWGVSDDTLLVGLLSQPIEWGDARAAASIVTLPVTANRDVKLLVHPDATRLQSAYEWARPLDLDRCFVQEADLAEPWRVLAGLDVALWLGNERTMFDLGPPEVSVKLKLGAQPVPGVLPMVWAMAAGLPVLAERCAASESLIRDGENGILFEPRDVPAGAQQVIALFDDAALRRKLGEAARREVEANDTIVHAVERLTSAYQQLVEVDRRNRPRQREAVGAANSPSSASAAST